MAFSVTTFVIVPWALFLIALERKFPYTKGQKVLRDGFFNDFVLYTLVQSWFMDKVIGWIIRHLDAASGLSRLHLVTSWPLVVQMLFFFVLHDFYIYWFHRAQHHNRFLWRIHEAHHATKDVDWLSGSRSHALEILVNQTVEFAPIVLLGARPEVVTFKIIIDAMWGMYIHSNIDVRSGALQRFFNGPEMHRWHHAIEITEGGINFGTKLAIWDYLFGTAVRPPEKPRGFGLLDEDFPESYLGQLFYAFRRFAPGRSPALATGSEASAVTPGPGE